MTRAVAPGGYALVALEELVKALGLPPVRFRGYRDQAVAVPVPKGFGSLFQEIELELRVQGDWGRLSWGWKHPQNGGSNGYTVGQVGYDEKRGQWYWKITNTNVFGYIESPDF